MSGIISLDTQAIESQQIKLANQTRLFHSGFLRVLKALQNQIKEEKRLYIAAGSVRSKRKVLLARRQDIIDKLFYEVDTMSMSMLEAQTLQYDYESMRYYYAKCLTSYVQYTEERIAVQKEKALIRMAGFAKNVIDDVEEDSRLPRNNKNQNILYILQTCMMKLISDSILPRLDQINILFQYLESTDSIDPIVLFNALQLLDILASQNWPKSKNLQKDEERQIVHRLMHVIPYGCTYIRTWDLLNYKNIVLFIVQLFQTLKSVLSILQVYGSSSEEILYGTSTSSTYNSSGSMNSNVNIGGSSSYRHSSTKHHGSSTVVDNSSMTDIGSSMFEHNTTSSAYNNNNSTTSTTGTTTHTTNPKQQDSTYYFHWSDTTPTGSGGTSSSPTRIYRDYNLTMDIILWLKTFKYVKIGYFGSDNTADVSLLDEFCTPDLYDIIDISTTSSTTTTMKEGVHDHMRVSVREYVLKELRVYMVLGSALMGNILQCAELMATVLIHTYNNSSSSSSSSSGGSGSSGGNSTANNNVHKSTKINTTNNTSATTSTLYNLPTTSPLIPSIPIYSTIIHTLLLCSIELGSINIHKYSYKLGPHGSSTGICYNNTNFLKAADLEVSVVLKCITIAISNGILEESSFSVIESMANIIIHRYNNYFLINSYLYNLISLILLLVEKEKIPENILNNTKKEIIQKYNNYDNIKTNPNISNSSIKPKETIGLIPIKTNFNKIINNSKLLFPISTNILQNNKKIINYINNNILSIMSIIVYHKNILTIIHPGLVLIRLLCRDLFLPRMRIEEILEIPLLSLLIPFMEYNTALSYYLSKEQFNNQNNNDEKERILEEKSIQDLTVRTMDTHTVGTIDMEYSTTTSIGGGGGNTSMSRLGSPNLSLCEDSGIAVGSFIESPLQSPVGGVEGENHNNSMFSIDNTINTTDNSRSNTTTTTGSANLKSIPLVSDYWKNWLTHNLESLVTGGEGYSAPKMNFIQYLQYISETHLQCTEIIEQLLLLIDHLINKSQVCKFQLIDHNIMICIQRIKSCYIDNIYMIALSEICCEQLELKI